MKVLRISGLFVLGLAWATLISFPVPDVSGQVYQTQPHPPGPVVITPAPAYGPAPMAPMGAGFVARFPQYGHDPEMAKLMNEEVKAEQEAAKLIREYGKTEDEGKRAKLKTKLADVLGKEFDYQQKRRDLDLTRLEAKVKKLRELMKKRTDARQMIVEKRLDQLIREAEGLGWTVPAGPSPNFPKATTYQLRPPGIGNPVLPVPTPPSANVP